jgi:uncharacterized protein (TIGR02118 family)
MVHFFVAYEQPSDVAAFDRHYFDVHVPLAKRLPGLRRYSVSRNPTTVRGPEPYHLVALLEWDDMDSLRQDFASPLGQETARDVDHLATLCPGIRSTIFELEDL